jgi:hypothetical protein
MSDAMSGPDGPEEREAYAQEQSWADEDRLDAIEDRAESDLMDIASDRLDSFAVAL